MAESPELSSTSSSDSPRSHRTARLVGKAVVGTGKVALVGLAAVGLVAIGQLAGSRND